MDKPGRRVAGDGPAARLAAPFTASTVAIVAMMPLEFQGGHFHYYNVLAVALLPALIAWLVVRKRPLSQGAAYFRGMSLALALVGAGGLALLAVAGQTSGLIRETIELGRFPTQAGAYLGIGLVGLIASLVQSRRMKRGAAELISAENPVR